ncbi:MAG: hypothetical protein Q4G24_01675 [Paracoccus sp. (in: a-proteobacteria)]|nr:hypothetical protein [Paracoccus sp. (in: a-proteobacteria)]MDO5620161.1 hypothetical protein [Paracoccus sp. (in: a-proteobacteria)]
MKHDTNPASAVVFLCFPAAGQSRRKVFCAPCQHRAVIFSEKSSQRLAK